MKTTTRNNDGYNVTIFRCDAETGEVISVQVGTFLNGRILRSSGHWSHENGLPEYHDAFMRSNGTFAGKPCVFTLVKGTDAMKAAMRSGFKAAMQRFAGATVAVVSR
jgi:hypothetical protein